MVGPLRMPIIDGRQHVAPDRILPEVRHVHVVEHVGRQEDGHGRPCLLVLSDGLPQALREEGTEGVLELREGLDGVAALPARRIPLLAGHLGVARDAPPIGLLEGALDGIGEGLLWRRDGDVALIRHDVVRPFEGGRIGFVPR